MSKFWSLLVMLGFVLSGCGAASGGADTPAPVQAEPAALQALDLWAETASAVPLSSTACSYPGCLYPTAHAHGSAAVRHCRNRLTDCASTWRYKDYAQTGNAAAVTAAPAPFFWNSMGCTDLSCTDSAHYHHCPADCTVADHYHNCPAGCTDASHPHSGVHHQDPHHTQSASAPVFYNSMGCVDTNCTDASHFHHCAAGCTVAEHYHNCPVGCNDASHPHGGRGHHGESHHGRHHG